MSEPLLTSSNATHIRFILSVRESVFLQILWKGEPFVTILARIFLILSMHVRMSFHREFGPKLLVAAGMLARKKGFLTVPFFLTQTHIIIKTIIRDHVVHTSTLLTLFIIIIIALYSCILINILYITHQV